MITSKKNRYMNKYFKTLQIKNSFNVISFESPTATLIIFLDVVRAAFADWRFCLSEPFSSHSLEIWSYKMSKF